MIRTESLHEEARKLLSFSPLQYMFDTVTERPHLARIYTDSLSAPSVCFLLFGHYLFIGGRVTDDFLSVFIEAELSGDKGNKLGALIVFYDKDSLTAGLMKSRFHKVYDGIRSLYRFKSPDTAVGKNGRITRIDKKLLSSGISNMEMIVNEVLGTATYDDMDDFCVSGFGYTYISGGRICAFCTSEYQSKGSVAIGIEVEKEHQGQGIASEMTKEFTAEASARKLKVFWECWKENIPSVKTALKCGFEKAADYPVFIIVFN